MAFTYGGDPANSNLETVRFLIGDTDSNKEQLNDAEIDYLLVESGGNVYIAGSDACIAIAATYGRLVDKEVGDLLIDYSQRQKSYLDLADRLRQQAAKKGTPTIYAGGIDASDKENNDNDVTVVQATFKRDMFTNNVNTDDNDAC